MSSRFDDGPDVDALGAAWARADDRAAANASNVASAETGAPAEGAEADRVWRAVAGELEPESLQALAEAAARDPELARSWRLARALHDAGAARGAEPAALPRPRPAASPLRWLAAAALVLVGLGAGLWLRPALPGPGGPAWRGGAAAGIRPALPDGAALPREAFVLRWVAVGEAGARYSLRVTTARLERVAEVSGLVAPEHRLPARDLAGLPAGTELFWQVDARLPDGRTISSPAVAVRIAD